MEREDEPSLQNIGNATLPVMKKTTSPLKGHPDTSGSIPAGINPKSVTTLKGPNNTQENYVSEANNLTHLNQLSPGRDSDRNDVNIASFRCLSRSNDKSVRSARSGSRDQTKSLASNRKTKIPPYLNTDEHAAEGPR